jgi:hypothetical protein
MARSYSRDSSGRFAGGARRGDVATTTQQNSAEHKRERRAEKAALSGGKIGTKRTKRVARTKAVGKRASTKAMRNALARARKRFT